MTNQLQNDHVLLGFGFAFTWERLWWWWVWFGRVLSPGWRTMTLGFGLSGWRMFGVSGWRTGFGFSVSKPEDVGKPDDPVRRPEDEWGEWACMEARTRRRMSSP